jgi:hypothetical protein
MLRELVLLNDYLVVLFFSDAVRLRRRAVLGNGFYGRSADFQIGTPGRIPALQNAGMNQAGGTRSAECKVRSAELDKLKLGLQHQSITGSSVVKSLLPGVGTVLVLHASRPRRVPAQIAGRISRAVKLGIAHTWNSPASRMFNL